MRNNGDLRFGRGKIWGFFGEMWDIEEKKGICGVRLDTWFLGIGGQKRA